MPRTALGFSHAALLALMLCGPAGAVAQVQWCCENVAHAGATPAERCDGNKTTFAKAEECAAKKSAHDRDTGHSSICGGAVEQTRKGTASGGSRSIR